jgi:hypothetical protein
MLYGDIFSHTISKKLFELENTIPFAKAMLAYLINFVIFQPFILWHFLVESTLWSQFP